VKKTSLIGCLLRCTTTNSSICHVPHVPDNPYSLNYVYIYIYIYNAKLCQFTPHYPPSNIEKEILLCPNTRTVCNCTYPSLLSQQLTKVIQQSKLLLLSVYLESNWHQLSKARVTGLDSSKSIKREKNDTRDSFGLQHIYSDIPLIPSIPFPSLFLSFYSLTGLHPINFPSSHHSYSNSVYATYSPFLDKYIRQKKNVIYIYILQSLLLWTNIKVFISF
jgi:hypothetical protein